MAKVRFTPKSYLTSKFIPAKQNVFKEEGNINNNIMKMKVLQLNMPVNLENSAVATELERSVFIPILKKGNAKECPNYRTIALISHASNAQNSSSQVSTVCELRTSRWTS